MLGRLNHAGRVGAALARWLSAGLPGEGSVGEAAEREGAAAEPRPHSPPLGLWSSACPPDAALARSPPPRPTCWVPVNMPPPLAVGHTGGFRAGSWIPTPAYIFSYEQHFY